jgi:phenylpyruvate tautomerase PptA (4-oxalocrotonate tautomerase family)
MPIYQVAAKVGTLTPEIRQRIAEAITNHHVEATGAPPSFVHVLFRDMPPGIQYSAGKQEDTLLFINGLIRVGRPLEVKQKLILAISASVSKITGKPEREFLVGVSEIDPATSMEMGLILPRPGEEAAWFAVNKEKLGGIEGTGL